jgi:hypothetical protein
VVQTTIVNNSSVTSEVDGSNIQEFSGTVHNFLATMTSEVDGSNIQEFSGTVHNFLATMTSASMTWEPGIVESKSISCELQDPAWMQLLRATRTGFHVDWKHAIVHSEVIGCGHRQQKVLKLFLAVAQTAQLNHS